MTFLRLPLVLGPLALLLGGCGSDQQATDGSLPGGLGSSMAILSCSLGCGSGIQGDPVTCGKGVIKGNEEIAVEFTQPVDMATVNKATFRITNALTGLAPPGVYVLDPNNSRRVIFRPEISFDENGSPEFGFEVGSSYTIRINGELQTDGPYLRSTSGKANQAGLFCNVSIGGGIVDSSPGPSKMTIFADQVVSYGPGNEVLEVAEGEVTGPAELTDVYSLSTIRLRFDDIISPVTVINPLDGTSPTVRFFIDPDGLIGGSDDWIQLNGTLSLELNEGSLSSLLTFKPASGFPSAGTGPVPRRIVVQVQDGILDLAGSPLDNPGTFGFVPEENTFGEVILPEGGEDFFDTTQMDEARSGGLWGGGVLEPGFGGGSGRMGDLVVTVAGSPFVLDTDSIDFQSFDVLQEGPGAFPPSETAPTVTATGGVFEFSTLTVENGATLQVAGSNPARIFVRGRALIQGLVTATGAAPASNDTLDGGHLSNDLTGGQAGGGGAGGGDGGRGADRFDNTGTTLLFLPGPGNGQPNPGAVVDGFEGQGLGGADPVLALGGGEGGVHWPTTTPFGLTDFGDFQPNDLCQGDQVANPGAGGGYATNGGESNAAWPNPAINDPGGVNMSPPTDALGGDPVAIGITAEVKELSPEKGHLRGGSGGGGGGAHVHLTRTNGPLVDCLAGAINFYVSHSGAGGGGGGGAIQVQAGSEVRVTGTLDLSGGDGGNSAVGALPDELDTQAAPGGGGSGGALLAQARQVILSSAATSIDITGGTGGLGVGGSLGGDGGAGVVRVETEFAADPALLAAKIVPYDTAPGSPTGGATSDVILSVDSWTADADGPGTRSGSQSCWLRPPGFFFQVTFPEDDLTDPLNPVLGWDMEISTPVAPDTPFSYRDANDPDNPFGGSAESLFGSDLGGVNPAPVLVRFQGARLDGSLEDLCDAKLDTEGGAIQSDSLTTWVRHPSELNTYWETVFPLDPQEVEARRPNVIRYMILFDRSSPDWPAFGRVHSFQILSQPD